MKTMSTHAAFAIVAAVAAGAQADIYQDPGIFAPFGNAQVDIVWGGSSAGYTGEVQWVDTAFEGAPQTLWTNHNATAEQTYRIPRLFAAGERVDFRYEIISGNIDAFATFVPADWAQFSVDASDPRNVVVGVEDIRYPSGDMDHNDAVFRVVFSQAAVPSPGSLALIGAGGVFMTRRRR
ncbi:MAG: PEP-CTERM sorting domain-containing protein [Phycisphaerales bacterium]|nr:PEP-CTERM sorting domain-containing protein [Phycisphaerales bacterium]